LLEKYALTSMCVDRFFLRVEEKNLTSPYGRRWSLPTWPLHACTASSPGPTKNQPLPWSVEEDARGRCTGMTPLRHCGTSLSWRGRRTAPMKMDGDVATGPPPCRTSLESRAIPATETRKAKAREGDRRRKPEKGIEGGRRGEAFIKKVWMRK
jgi:hypothetical protein